MTAKVTRSVTPGRAIALKLTSVLLFTIMASLIKASSDDVPPGQAVFFRAFFAMPVILGWLAWQGNLRHGLKAQNPMGHVWRGLIGVSAMGCGFASLGLLPLPEVTVLGYAAPLLTVVFAALLLGERIRAFRIAAVFLGLIGVVIVLWPRLSLDSVEGAARLGVALALASAALRALAHVHIRKLVATETTAAITFYFAVTATLMSLLTIPFGWQVPPLTTVLMLICAGFVGGCAQILMTSAYRGAGAGLLAPFDYASILFAVAIGYAIFDEAPGWWVIAGSAVIITAGVLIIWRERQLGLKRGTARQGLTPQG